MVCLLPWAEFHTFPIRRRGAMPVKLSYWKLRNDWFVSINWLSPFYGQWLLCWARANEFFFKKRKGNLMIIKFPFFLSGSQEHAHRTLYKLNIYFDKYFIPSGVFLKVYKTLLELIRTKKFFILCLHYYILLYIAVNKITKKQIWN